MGSRLELQVLLETILESSHVYFQAPSNIKMEYPAIVYKLDDLSTKFADNKPYLFTERYEIMVIDRDPDNLIPKKIAALPMCLFSRSYPAEGLNHTVFTLYF